MHCFYAAFSSATNMVTINAMSLLLGSEYVLISFVAYPLCMILAPVQLNNKIARLTANDAEYR